MQEKKANIYVADKDFSVTEVAENIYNVAVKIAPRDVKCTLGWWMWGETLGGRTTRSLYSHERRSISHNMCLNLTYWLCDLLPRKPSLLDPPTHIKKNKKTKQVQCLYTASSGTSQRYFQRKSRN